VARALWLCIKKNDPALAGEMMGYLEGKIIGEVGSGYVMVGASTAIIQKVTRLKTLSKAGKGGNLAKQETIVQNNNWGALDDVSKTVFNASKNNLDTWVPKDKHMVGTSATRTVQYK
jgi:hypothetical protein